MGWLRLKSLAPRWGYLPKALYQTCWGRKSNVDFWWITSIESLLFGSLFWGCLKTQLGSGEEQVAKLAEDNCILPLASLFFSRFGVAKCQEIEGLAERGGLICPLSEGLQPLKWLESTTDHPVEPIRKELSIARQKLRASQRRKSRGLEICRLGEWRQQCEKLVAGYDVYWDICTRVNSIRIPFAGRGPEFLSGCATFKRETTVFASDIRYSIWLLDFLEGVAGTEDVQDLVSVMAL